MAEHAPQSVNLEGSLGLDARISGGHAFGQLADAFTSRLNQEPAFADVLQKFVDYTHAHGTQSGVRFNGKSNPDLLSEELLGKWAGLAAEHTLLDAKTMPDEADGARWIALEGDVARLEDAITLAHRGVKNITVDERFIKIIADPTGDTQKRITNSLDVVTQALSTTTTRTAMKVLPVVIAGEMLFSSCTPVRPTINPDTTLPAMTQQTQMTETPVPTATRTATSTEIPMPEGLATVPEGYSAVRNPDGTWGYGAGVGAEVSIPNLTVDGAGAHFRLEGTTIDIPTYEMKDRIQVGQAGALQIYDYGTYHIYKIRFAWNADQNVWINAEKIVQPVRNDIPNYITVQTREQLAALFDLEKLVMSPFPADTYFPPLDKVIIDYQHAHGNYDTTKDFSFYTPFGKVTDMAQSPFRFVNFILLEKSEGRKSDTWILTEQVYNPADGTFSLLHFGFDKYGEKPEFLDTGLSTLFFSMDPPHILLPAYAAYETIPFPGYASCNVIECNQMEFFIENNYFNAATGRFPEIQRLVEVWLTTGKVPDELESLVNIGFMEYIMTKTGP